MFHLQPCLLKYIQLSSVDQRAPPSLTLSSTAAEQETHAYCLYHSLLTQTHHRALCQAMSRTVKPGSSGESGASFQSPIVLRSPYDVTYKSNLYKWWQILVIPHPYLSLTLFLFQSQEPQLKAVLWVQSVGQTKPNVTLQRCICFLLTFHLHITLFHFVQKLQVRLHNAISCHQGK